MSARAAAVYFNKDRKTIADMLRHELPPGYRRSEPPHRPTLDAYVGIIDAILRTDKALIKKQRHTAKRIFERLRDEHGYAGSLTTVTYYVCERKQRTKEVFVLLSHHPGHARVDFGEALGVTCGVVMSTALPTRDILETAIARYAGRDFGGRFFRAAVVQALMPLNRRPLGELRPPPFKLPDTPFFLCFSHRFSGVAQSIAGLDPGGSL